MKRTHQILFLLFFALSAAITWAFIAVSTLYISKQQMLLSTIVAGAKWGIQVLAALFFLKENKWLFLKKIALVCFLGSLTLIPYIVLSKLEIANEKEFFVGSLAAAVILMIIFYYRAVKQSGVAIKWWYGWLLCLAIAISLQLTVVVNAR